MPASRSAVLVAALAIGLGACGGPALSPSPSPSPSAAAVQRHACGNLAADLCEEVIGLVIRQVPSMADSPIAVTATVDPDAQLRRGGDLEVLVAFAPPSDTDLWFNPPTWIVTQTMLTDDWRVEPWRGDRLPAHFLALLRAAGFPV